MITTATVTTKMTTTMITEMTITATIMIKQMIIGLFQTLFCISFHCHRHRGKSRLCGQSIVMFLITLEEFLDLDEVCLSIRPNICPSDHPSEHLSIQPSIRPFVHPTVRIIVHKSIKLIQKKFKWCSLYLCAPPETKVCQFWSFWSDETVQKALAFTGLFLENFLKTLLQFENSEIFDCCVFYPIQRIFGKGADIGHKATKHGISFK